MWNWSKGLGAVALALGIGIGLDSSVGGDPKKKEEPAKPALQDPPPPSKEQIAQWIKDLADGTYQVRDKATKALVEAGPVVLEALAEAGKSKDVEIQRRVAQIRDRIETAAVQAPTLIRLKLKDVAVPKAVEELSKRSKRMKLELVPQQGPGRQVLEQKKITLDLDRVPFWEALERLCLAADLSYFPRTAQTIQLQLIEGQAPRIPTAVSAAFRFRVTGMNYYRNLTFLNSGNPGGPVGLPGRNESLTVSFDIVSEPHVRVMSIAPPQITEAVDDAGQSLVTQAATQTNYYSPYYGNPNTLQTLTTQTSLRPATRPSATLKILKGTLPVEILAKRQPLVTADDFLKSRGKVFKGEDKFSLIILQVQDNQGGRNGNFRFLLTGLDPQEPGKNPNDGEIARSFELTDADGRPLNLNYNYGNDRRNEGLFEGNFYYSSTPESGPAARLSYYGHNRIRTSVSFEFKDVPMP